MATHLKQSSDILNALEMVKTIALLGASSNPERPSNDVMAFLLSKGYHVIPINPGQAGNKILGQEVYASLADIPEHIDMVDVFRNVEAVPGIIDDVLALKDKPALLWLQLDIIDEQSAKRAIAAGINVVMDRCPAIELGKYSE